jgi:hypothetical protein
MTKELDEQIRQFKANSIDAIKAMALQSIEDMEALDDLCGISACQAWYKLEAEKDNHS